MEAKDTVMKDEELAIAENTGIRNFLAEGVPTSSSFDYQMRRSQVVGKAIALAQAEISFKAGRDSIIDEMVESINIAQRNSIKAGKKAGRKEVVEWVKGCTRTGDCFQEDGSVAYRAGDIIMTKALWQAKLKEWGIE